MFVLYANVCRLFVFVFAFLALTSLIKVILFVRFVFVIVLSFGDIYKVSSMNQMLVTLFLGFLPMVLRTFLAPPAPDVEIGTVVFKSKMDEVIKNFRQLWPIYDLPFELFSENTQIADGRATPCTTASTEKENTKLEAVNNNTATIKTQNDDGVVTTAYGSIAHETNFDSQHHDNQVDLLIYLPQHWLGALSKTSGDDMESLV